MLTGGGSLELGRRICESVIPRAKRKIPVLIKPNMGGFDSFRKPQKPGGDDGVRGRITEPEFVRGVIRCLKRRGHRTITVADGWGGSHAAWQKLVQLSGYEELARSEGVRLVAMNDDGTFDREGTRPGEPLVVTGMERTLVPTLRMPRLLAEHLEGGLYISVPKIKAHRFSVVSVSIKGTMGTVMLADAKPAHRQKWRMHRELGPWMKKKRGDEPPTRADYVAALTAFSKRLIDVLVVEAPHVVLAEGTPAMGGDGFQRMVPRKPGFAVGGTNPILVDRVASQLLGLWDVARLGHEQGGWRSSPPVVLAARRWQPGEPRVEGDGADLLETAAPPAFRSMAGFSL